MQEVIKTIFTSWPAMITLSGVLIFLILVLRFPNEVKEKLKTLIGLGGDKGAKWDKDSAGQLPESGLDKIKADYQKADDILKLQTQNDELLKIAQQLNKELEDTRILLFFERVARAMVNWQYFILKLGCEKSDRKLTIREAILETKKAYPDLDQFVTEDILVATLDDLQTLNFIKAFRPYTADTTIEFTELTLAFLVYFNTGKLSI